MHTLFGLFNSDISDGHLESPDRIRCILDGANALVLTHTDALCVLECKRNATLKELKYAHHAAYIKSIMKHLHQLSQKSQESQQSQESQEVQPAHPHSSHMRTSKSDYPFVAPVAHIGATSNATVTQGSGKEPLNIDFPSFIDLSNKFRAQAPHTQLRTDESKKLVTAHRVLVLPKPKTLTATNACIMEDEQADELMFDNIDCDTVGTHGTFKACLAAAGTVCEG